MASSKTLQAIVEIAGSLSPTLGKAAEEASKSLEGINLKAVAVGAGVAAAGAAIGKATIEAGKYLVDLGGQFDNVVDTIRIGTGATGDAPTVRNVCASPSCAASGSSCRSCPSASTR